MSQTEFDFEAKRQERKEASKAIVERIKKLLRLGADKRGNPHEAERAMQLAFELAEKHRVDVAGLDLDEESARLVHEHWHIGERLDRLRRGIFSLLQHYFHVTCCITGRHGSEMLVIGRPQDVTIARYLYDFLLRSGRECLRSYLTAEKNARRQATTNKRAAFLTGFLYGLSFVLANGRKAIPLNDAQSALVVAEEAERENKLSELIPERAKVKALPDRKHRGAMMSGFDAGEATTIHQPLTGAPNAPLLLS